jgi:hypothetical protein
MQIPVSLVERDSTKKKWIILFDIIYLFIYNHNCKRIHGLLSVKLAGLTIKHLF